MDDNLSLIHLINVLNETLKILTEYGIEDNISSENKGEKVQDVICEHIIKASNRILSTNRGLWEKTGGKS